MKFFFLTMLACSVAFMLRAQDTPKQDSLQEYTGKYKFPEGSIVTEITVVLDNGVLTGNSAMGSSELRKTEGDVFEVVAYGGTATFKRNAEKKITGVQFIVGDVNIEGTKTEGLSANFFYPLRRTINR